MQAAPLGFTSGAMILMHLLGYAVKGRLQLASHSMLWMQFALVLIVLMFYAWLGIALSHQAIRLSAVLFFNIASACYYCR